MPGQFQIRQAFRHVTNDRLKVYFETMGCPLPLDWASLREADVEPIFDAWRQLPEKHRLNTQRDLEDAWILATARGTQALLSAAESVGIVLMDDLRAIEAPIDKAIWVRTEHEPVWQELQKFLPVDRLSGFKRRWRRFRDLKVRSINDPAGQCRTLADRIGRLIEEVDGYGKHRYAEHHQRHGRGEDYFSVFVDDGVEVDVAFGEGDLLDRRTRSEVANIAFIYTPQEGLLSVYTERDAKFAYRLYEIFHDVIFGEPAPPDDTRQSAYNLDRVLASDFRPNSDLPAGNACEKPALARL